MYVQVHASPEAEVTWYRGTMLLENDNRWVESRQQTVVSFSAFSLWLLLCPWYQHDDGWGDERNVQDVSRGGGEQAQPHYTPGMEMNFNIS